MAAYHQLRPRGGLPKAQKLCRTAHSTRRQWMIQDAQLRQHRRVIPVSMLVRDFAAIELDEGGADDFGFSAGGPYPREEPIHIDRMGKTYCHLFDDAVIAESLRHSGNFEIRRDVG